MKAGDTYRHFKGGIYFIVGVAEDENGEMVVIYQSSDDRKWRKRSLTTGPSPFVDKITLPTGEIVDRFKLLSV